MSGFHLTCARLVSIFVLALSLLVSAEDIPHGLDVHERPKPSIFKDRAADRLAAEEVAKQDAYRKLCERIYGFTIDGQTDVYDFVLQNQQFDAALQHEIKGMNVIDTKYYEDGRVEVAVKITHRQVVEKISKVVKSIKKLIRGFRKETIENITHENRDTDIIVVGRGALKNSEGLRKVRAMRAAEIDCYGKLASKIFSIQLDANTKVRDFVLASDEIHSKLNPVLLNGVKFTDYRFLGDGTCEADGQVTMREVVEVLTRTVRRYGSGKTNVTEKTFEDVERKNRDRVITATGSGAVRPEASASTPSHSFVPFEEKRTVIERVISEGIIVK